MRTFYDAITPANIPITAQGVCGYVDGKYAWTAADWARFPHSVKARIAVFSSTNDGHILDVEAGCSTPGNAPGWVVRRRAAGIDPTVYCSLSAWPTVKVAFANAGVAEPHWWIAAYPGNGPNLYPGAVAHQYADPGPLDLSVVADYWPGVDPKPAPLPGPPSPIRPVPNPVPPAPIGGLIVRTIDLRNASSAHPVTGLGIKPLQRLLGIKADGVAGDHTRWALGAQQAVHKLAVDYIFGPASASAFLAGN
jgi:hypothetical protein